MDVDRRLRELREPRIGVFFFLERFFEKIGDVLEAELPGERRGRAVARNFIVLDTLRRANQSSVPDRVFGLFANQISTFRNEPIHGFAFVSGEFHFELFSDLFEAFEVPFRLLQMLFEAADQVLVGRRRGHLWQGFQKLRLRAVEVLEFMVQEVGESIEFHVCNDVSLR